MICNLRMDDAGGAKKCHVIINDFYRTLTNMYYYNGEELVELAYSDMSDYFAIDIPAGILYTITEYKSSPLTVSSGDATRFSVSSSGGQPVSKDAGYYIFGDCTIG